MNNEMRILDNLLANAFKRTDENHITHMQLRRKQIAVHVDMLMRCDSNQCYDNRAIDALYNEDLLLLRLQ
jgi:hypothetical protein